MAMLAIPDDIAVRFELAENLTVPTEKLWGPNVDDLPVSVRIRRGSTTKVSAYHLTTRMTLQDGNAALIAHSGPDHRGGVCRTNPHSTRKWWTAIR